MNQINKILHGNTRDKLKELDNESIDCCITSPPYFRLRDYRVDGQIGWEDTPKQYIQNLADICDEIKRVLKSTGSFWLNITDKFQNKALLRIPERLVLELEDRGWLGAQTVIWNKSNAMPMGGGASTCRFNVDFEYLYHFTKSRNYYFKQQYEQMKEDTLRESKYHSVNPNKSQKHRQGLLGYKPTGIDNWKSKKDYNNHQVQTPLQIKKSIINKIHFGDKKLNQTENTYILSDEDKRNAISLGWDGDTDYADWYFNIRTKKSYHNHQNDNVMGFGHQSRGEGKLQLAYPYGSIKRAVWRIAHAQYPNAHFAVFPEKLIEVPILATSQPNDTILDPFMGSGTTALVSLKNARNFVGIELNQDYINLAMKRLEPYLLQTKLQL